MGNPSTMQWAPKIPQKMTRDIDNDIFTGCTEEYQRLILQLPLEFSIPLWAL